MDTKSNNQINNLGPYTHIENSEIVIDYVHQSNDALFDICDLSGSIIMSGRLSDSSRIEISTLPKGVYVFYIIDKGIVLKEKVKL